MAFANQSRIEQTVEALAQFNATPGAGITRLSYTTEYRAAQAYLKRNSRRQACPSASIP